MNGKYWHRAWSLVDHCTPVSEGCAHCWLKSMEHRFHREGPVTPRYDRLGIPLGVKKPTVWAVWSDLFHENVPDEFIERVYSVMHRDARHTYLILTKRPDRALKWYSRPASECTYTIIGALQKYDRWMLNNVYLGVTAENQEQADKRIPILLQVPARRFVSIEPCLSEIDLQKAFYRSTLYCGETEWEPYETGAGIDWVILGPETGPKRRVCDPQWMRSIVDQCEASDVPIWAKAFPAVKYQSCPAKTIEGISRDMNEWPEWARKREVPWT